MKKAPLLIGLYVFFLSSYSAAGLAKQLQQECRIRFFINNAHMRYSLPPKDSRDNYWQEKPSIGCHQIAEFDDQTIELKIVVAIEACRTKELHITSRSIKELTEQFSIQFIDGKDRIQLGQISMSLLHFTRVQPLVHQVASTEQDLWTDRFQASLPLQGTWFASDFFVDRWLCVKIIKPDWAEKRIISDFPACMIRWKPKTDSQKALQLCAQARFLGTPPWEDPWKNSQEELFQEKVKLYKRANQLDPIYSGGWFGLFQLYRERGMMREANAALDKWKELSPKDMHDRIEDIRAGRGRL